MDSNFSKRLEEYLSSECSDYSLSYKWVWIEDCNWCEIEIERGDFPIKSTCINFKYNKLNDDLLIELTEDSFYVTREYDQTVKYFWMLIGSRLFYNDN